MSNKADEVPVVFSCHDSRLIGILHRPREEAKTGVLIVVGGPQYRVGSHRQFVLLARSLATAGIPSFRFDYRGMGDSEGAFIGFEDVADDIRCAIDEFVSRQPGLERIVLWGLCDAASAAMMYCASDDRVVGSVLLNPWVRTESGQAATIVRHYYASQIVSPVFWKRLLTGRVGFAAALRDFGSNIFRSLGLLRDEASDGRSESGTFIDRMFAGLSSFSGRSLIIISGQDLTAAEFTDLVEGSDKWRRLVRGPSMTIVRLEDADHTFSTAATRGSVETITIDWIRDLS